MPKNLEVILSWYLAPSLARLRSQVSRKWPTRATASDGTLGDAAHRAQGTASDHNPDPVSGVVRAIDFTVNTTQGEAILAATWQDPRTWYVIWRSKIYFRGETTPRPYTGLNAHASHIHISINRTEPSAETDVTNWKGLGMPRMISPAQGKVSSEYGWRPALGPNIPAMHHAGLDIANATGTPIYAAYAGTVIGAGTNGVPGRTGKYVLIANPDGERQYYGHLSEILVTEGQKVAAGDLIAKMGATGNVTGPHLHFEVWANASHTSHRNPRLDFDYHGVVPGSKPVVPKPAPKPKPKPSASAKPGAGLSAAEIKRIQRALAVMGYDVGPDDGDYGDRTIGAVKAYQRDHGLHPDGDWGKVTQRYWTWVKSLQTALNQWAAVQRLGTLRVDGQRGSLTRRAETEVQKPAANRRLLGTTKASLFRGLGIKPEPAKRG